MNNILIILISVTIWFIPIIIGIKVIRKGKYKCNNCHQQFIPSCRNILLSIHRGTERYLKCPNCNKRSWCNEILSK